MIQLWGDEFGYDPEKIGFPSVLGCHAIVYLTTEGLFGFHNMGGTDKKDRGAWLAEFAKTNFVSATKGIHLYSACSRTDGSGKVNARGYSKPTLKSWQEEMKTFAKALNFKGPISGFDVDKAAGWPTIVKGTDRDSAYFEFRKAGSACTIHYCPWQKTDGGKKGACTNKANHKVANKKTGAIEPIPGQIFTSVTVTNATDLLTASAKELDTFKV